MSPAARAPSSSGRSTSWRIWRTAARAPFFDMPGLRGEPRGRRAVPISVVSVRGVETAQESGVRGGELRLDLAERDQHRPARGGVQLARHPGR